MSDDRFVSAHGGPFNVEAMRQFWDAALNRVKAYAEAAEPCVQPITDATTHSTPRIDDGDGKRGAG
jgi:hypothetical protein